MKNHAGLNRVFEVLDEQVRHENPWIKVIDYRTRTDGQDGIYTVIERKADQTMPPTAYTNMLLKTSIIPQ